MKLISLYIVLCDSINVFLFIFSLLFCYLEIISVSNAIFVPAINYNVDCSNFIIEIKYSQLICKICHLASLNSVSFRILISDTTTSITHYDVIPEVQYFNCVSLTLVFQATSNKLQSLTVSLFLRLCNFLYIGFQ